jgi:class 3 adenylate cyclase/tetratricopeptide (TPR) repeat protein
MSTPTAIGGNGADRLGRYVPRLLSDWDELEPRHAWRAVDSTLVFVDLSGFTMLSERLARRGRIGTEELTSVLNCVFGSMLEAAAARGGAMLKFGGDALLLQFTGDRHPLDAVCAAIEMRAALRTASAVPTSVGRVALRMSVGVHTGPVFAFRVGTSHHELVVTGATVTRVVDLENAASAGEILLSDATARHLPPSALGARKGPGIHLRWRKPPVPPADGSAKPNVAPATVASCVPVALRRHLADGSIESEHRTATIAFIKFEGVDPMLVAHGPEVVADALHQLVSTVQRIVDGAEVTLLASDLDRDGGKIILAAGIPSTGDDDAGRMLRVVRAIVDASTVLPVRVGVSRGHVFAGEIGTDRRATYTVIGDTVNVAARLAGRAAPGQIYATLQVVTRSRVSIRHTALESFAVRGKSQLVHAVSIGTEDGDALERRGDGGAAVDMATPFSGRRAECDRLTKALVRGRSGMGCVIRIAGPAGIGKTRLVEEAVSIAGRAQVIRFRADQHRSGAAYGSVRDPFRALLGVRAQDQPARVEELGRAIQQRAPEVGGLMPLLADVVDVDVEPSAAVRAIDVRFRPDRTADLVIDLLDRFAEQPLVFVFDDAQWFDSASSALAARIASAARERDWVVLVLRRHEPGGADPPADERIDLRPLGAGDGRAIVLARGQSLREHEIDQIVVRSGGNPMFLLELVDAALEGGTAELPASLAEAVSVDFDALSPGARRVVRYAAVLGSSFRVATLRQLLASDGDGSDMAITVDTGRFLVDDGEDLLRFRHPMLRDVVYEGLSYGRRRDLHLRAGRIIEQLAEGSTDAVADLLAMHFAQAQQHELAWHFGRIAGDRASARYANVEAAAEYELALDAARRMSVFAGSQVDGSQVDGSQVGGTWRQLGVVRERLGQYEGALDAFARAAPFFRNDPEAAAELLLRRARVWMHLGEYRAALAAASRGRSWLRGRSEPQAGAMRARLLALQALIRQAQQRAEAARQLAVAAVAEAESAADDVARARAYLVLDWAHRVLGIGGGGALGSRALELSERLGDLDEVGKASNNLGALAYYHGDWQAAGAWYRRALDAYRRCGNNTAAAVAASNLGELLVSRREFDEANSVLLDATRVLRAAHALDDLLFAEMQLGRLMMERGDHAAAIEYLTPLRMRAAAVGQTGYALEAGIQIAAAMVGLARFGDAISLLDAAAADVSGVDGVYQPAWARVRSMALAGLGRFDEARTVNRDGITRARDQGLRFEEAQLLVAAIGIDRGDGVTTADEVWVAMRARHAELSIDLPGHVL